VPNDAIEVLHSLSASRAAEILAVAAREALLHGREALTDQARRTLKRGGSARHFLLSDTKGTLLAYAQLRISGPSAELEFLGDHLNDELLGAAVAEASMSGCEVACWLHGLSHLDPAPSPTLTLTRGLRRLTRGLPGDPVPELPAGLSLRPFEPGLDEAAFLGVNASSFASHPDQGRMSHEDLLARQDEQWFDPSCFFLLEDDTELLGFCWVKVHEDPWGRAGEIYVIGMAPPAAGRGLGRLLLRTGLQSMAEQGLSEAFLYVEEDNHAARGLYDAEGFRFAWFDALFDVATPTSTSQN